MKDETRDAATLATALEKREQEWRVDQVLLKSYANDIGELRKTVAYWKARAESADRLLATYRAAAAKGPSDAEE